MPNKSDFELFRKAEEELVNQRIGQCGNKAKGCGVNKFDSGEVGLSILDDIISSGPTP